MPNIYEYINYRTYLTDYYAEKKKANPTFSYGTFSLKAGFKSKGYCYMVINGGKNLSKSSVIKICQAIGLSPKESGYFENLVFFNQAIDHKERSHFFDQLVQAKPPNKSMNNPFVLRKDQYEFFAKWYNIVIRSLLEMHAFKGDYTRLARMVRPAIMPKQAKKAVQLLQRLGLAKQQANGVYKIADKSITTGEEVLGLAVANFHIECMKLAQAAIEELPRDKRNITGLTLGMSRKSYELICEELQQFQTKVMQIANEDQDADTVYQFNFHLFPVSKTDNERK